MLIPNQSGAFLQDGCRITIDSSGRPNFRISIEILNKLVSVNRLNIYYALIIVTCDKCIRFIDPIISGYIIPTDTVTDIILIYILATLENLLGRIFVNNTISRTRYSHSIYRLFTGDRLRNINDFDIFDNRIVTKTENISYCNFFGGILLITFSYGCLKAVNGSSNIGLNRANILQCKFISGVSLNDNFDLVIFTADKFVAAIHKSVTYSVIGHIPTYIVAIVTCGISRAFIGNGIGNAVSVRRSNNSKLHVLNGSRAIAECVGDKQLLTAIVPTNSYILTVKLCSYSVCKTVTCICFQYDFDFIVLTCNKRFVVAV